MPAAGNFFARSFELIKSQGRTQDRMSGEARDDTSLIREIGRGDENAFVELYRRRQRDVHRFVYTMSRSRALAEDVTQDVFLNVLMNAGRFDPVKGTVRAWLLGCARNVLIDRLRRDGRETGGDAEEPAVACTGEQQVFAEQRLRRLHAAILELPTEYREAIVLCELEELSYAECATVLGCPIGTVRSRLHRGRTLLAARLAARETEARGAADALGDCASEACRG